MKILIAEDHPIYAEGLVNLLNSYGYSNITIVNTGKDAVNTALNMIPHVILMDLNLPELNGIEATKHIKEKLPQIKIIILTSISDTDAVYHAIHAGASGYLQKNLNGDELIKKMNALIENKFPDYPDLKEKYAPKSEKIKSSNLKLSSRHLVILSHLANGLTYKEIADTVCLSERTIKYHIDNIKGILNLKTQAQLIAYFQNIEFV